MKSYVGELKDRIALITGASQGIGAACAELMARQGASVVVNYRQSRAQAEALAMRIRNTGSRVLVIQADVTNLDQVRGMMEQVVTEWGGIDILVNNVGHHAIQRYTIETMPLDNWYQSLNSNLTSQILCVKAALPFMLKRKWGRIINIGSVTAQRGSISGDICYAVSKAGVHGLTLALFRQLAGKGITVNTVSPGTIDTAMTREVLSPKQIQAYVRNIPMRRMGRPEEVAEVICFLASERASYITGQLIAVNGGQYV